MFERFTDRARRVIVLAQEEARALRHDYIGTEHLLLGLIAEGEGVGAKALQELNAPLDAVRREVAQVVGQGGAEVGQGQIPFTPRAKRVLELALQEALALGHNYIGTEHVLLGLVREGEGVAAQVLGRLAPDLATVRSTVVRLLAAHGLARTAPPAALAPTAPATRFSPALRAALEAAAGRASNAASIGTHHLLSVFADWADVAARRVLDAGGFDRSALDMPIDDFDIAGTRDETDDEWSLRVTEMAATDDGVSIRVLEPELHDALRRMLEHDDSELRKAFGRMVRELDLRSRPSDEPE